VPGGIEKKQAIGGPEHMPTLTVPRKPGKLALPEMLVHLSRLERE
jgi:hypothetical protein